MSILGWVFFGLITGFIASRIVNRRGEGFFVNTALGLVGAIVGGLIFQLLTNFDSFAFNLTSMFVAIIGAIVVLLIYNAVSGQRGLR